MDAAPAQTLQKKKKPNWHALSVDEVIKELKTTPDGLTDEEVGARHEEYGENAFSESKSDTLFTRIASQFRSALTIVLLLAFVVTLGLGEFIDASVIFSALAIAIVLGVVQEGKASRAFEKLSSSQTKRATVVRDGKPHEVDAKELVPGDVVEIRNGAQVPADLRIMAAKNLSINEAALTGEWVSVQKSSEEVDVGTLFADMTSMAHLGTYVAEGRGRGVVVATGDQTAMGEIASDLDAIVDEETPIQLEMARISRIMLIIIVALIALIFIIGVFSGQPLEMMLLTSIAIAVAAVPEGLPAAVTIILAIGMEALLNRGGLVRNLLAAETLGSTTYILTDKTGTLTEARMAVADVLYIGCPGKKEDASCEWQDDEHAKAILDVALCASDAYLDESANGEEKYIVRGTPMERAILEAAQEVGVTPHGESARARRLDYLAFESANRFAAGLAKWDGELRLCVNGAPELLLEKATRVMTPDGNGKLTKGVKAHYEAQMLEHTKQGRRLIGIGYTVVDYDDIPDEGGSEILEEIVFAGLLVIDDPVREDVKEAITGVLAAGAQVRLVTGDNPETALAVAKEVGIARSHDVVLTGDHIATQSDAELLESIRSARVFARVLPRQKMRLAQVLQTSGEIVAMTGDGINDASALRKANIGVAIGSGTEVAKESSDLVLLNDSFTTIYAAIEEGRRIIQNLRRIVGYLLSTSLSEAVLIGGALVTGAALPILPTQILWANIIEEGLMSVAFAFEPGDKNAMKEKPRDIHEEGVLSKGMLRFTAVAVLILSILLLCLYAFLRLLDIPIEELRSVMFLAISLDSLFIAFSFRSLTVPLWKIPLKTNKFFIGAFLISLTLFVIVLSVPFLQYLFSYQPVTFLEFALVFLYSSLSVVTIEVGKWFFFERKK